MTRSMAWGVKEMLDGGGWGLHNRVNESVRSTREGEGAIGDGLGDLAERVTFEEGLEGESRHGDGERPGRASSQGRLTRRARGSVAAGMSQRGGHEVPEDRGRPVIAEGLGGTARALVMLSCSPALGESSPGARGLSVGK